MLGIDIRDHGIGLSGGGSTDSSNLKTVLKYTTSLNKPSSPNIGDLWINTNSTYSNLTVCRKLPSVTDSNTLYLLVMGVYGTVNTTKINSMLNNSYSNTGTVEFDINLPNSKNNNFMNVKLMNQGSDVFWYGSPYQVFLGSNKIATYSWNGTKWVQIGFVLYLQEQWDSNVDSLYGFWRYVLGDNKITNVKSLSRDSAPAYTSYSMVNTFQSYSAKSTIYNPSNNCFYYTGYNGDIYNQTPKLIKWSLSSNTLTTEYHIAPLSRVIIDGGYFYYVAYLNNHLQFIKVNISAGSLVSAVILPLISGSSYSSSISLFFNVKKIGNKIFVWAYNENSSNTHVEAVYGYYDMNLNNWKDFTSGNNYTYELAGMILDYDETNNIIYGIRAVSNRAYSNYTLSNDLVLYKYNITTSTETLITGIKNCIKLNTDSSDNGNYQYLNEDSNYVYFCYTNGVVVNNFNSTSLFRYSKQNKNVEYLNPTSKLEDHIGDEYFKNSNSSNVANGTNTNTFTIDNNLFVYDKTGLIKYINMVEGDPMLTLNIGSMVKDTTKFVPIFVTNGIMDNV